MRPRKPHVAVNTEVRRIRLRDLLRLRPILEFLWIAAWQWAICWYISMVFNPAAAAFVFMFILVMVLGGTARGPTSPLWRRIPDREPMQKWATGLPIAVAGLPIVGAIFMSVADSCRPECAGGIADGMAKFIGIYMRIGQDLLPGSGGLHEIVDWVLGFGYLYVIAVAIGVTAREIPIIARYLRLVSL